MFCFNCGKEVPEGKSFCTNCGAPVAKSEDTSSGVEAQVRPPEPTPPAPATTGIAPAPKKRKIWPVVLGIVAVLVVVAVVLVLVLVVFKSSSPTSAVAGFFKGVENNDSAAVMKVIDPTYFKQNKELEAIFKKEVLGTMPEGVKFSGIQYSATTRGNKGTVKVTKGTISYTENGKKQTVDITKLDSGNKYDMVKVDGTWYISPTTFASVFGRAFKKSADAVMNESLGPKSIALGKAFGDLSASMSATPTPGSQQMKAQLAQVEQQVKEYKDASAKAKAAYQKIAEISGSNVANYKDYANAAVGFIDSSNEVFSTSAAFLDYVVSVKAAAEAGQTPDMNAYNQKTAEYSAKVTELQKKMSDFQAQMNALDKKME
jgi:hypothetical protein